MDDLVLPHIILLRKEVERMSATLKVILTWAERIATVVLIAVPAIRSISSEVDAAKVEIDLIRKDDD